MHDLTYINKNNNNFSSSPKTFLLDDFHYVGNLNGEPRIVPAISPKHAAAVSEQKGLLPLSPIPKRIKYSPMRYDFFDDYFL